MVIGYLRVSTDKQAVSGLGLGGQRSVLPAESARRGWTNVEYLAEAGYSSKKLFRPAIAAALDYSASARRPCWSS